MFFSYDYKRYFFKEELQMFNNEELFIIKELVEIEVSDVDGLIDKSSGTDKDELQRHKVKLINILNKINMID